MSDGQNNLNSHLAFVQKMLQKVENTEFETKWKQLKDLINSTERINLDKVSMVESTLSSLKEKLKTFEENQNETPMTKESKEIQNDLKTPEHPKKKVKLKTTDSDTIKSPIKISLTRKYATMPSPRNEKIILKLNLNEIHRIKTLKRQRKRNKRISLLIRTRGQSLKRELMSPPHNSFDSILPENVETPNDNDAQPTASQQPEIPDILNLGNTLESHGIKTCSVVLERISEIQNTSKTDENNKIVEQPQNTTTPILLRKLLNNPPTSKRQSAQKTNTPILKKILQETPTIETTSKRRSIRRSNSPILKKVLQETPAIETSHKIASQITQKSLDVQPVPKPNISPHNSKTEGISNGQRSPPMISIPSDLVFPSKSKEILLNSDSTMRKLRPWLKSSDHQKQLNYCNEMLTNEHCLASLYKCMASSCGYYTNKAILFHQHLRLHWDNQRYDAKNFCQCPYCDFKNENSYLDYINHVTDKHEFTKYQCCYCFYRSYDYHIVTHMKVFHSLKLESTIVCKPNRLLNPKQELSDVWRNFFTNCRTMTCVVCKEKFLSIKHFQHHFEQHTTIPSSQCIKCKMIITQETMMDHLKVCHGFGNYNCAFCRFGTDSIDALKIHLSNEHANKFLFFFDRCHQNLNVDTVNNEISKQLAVKQLTLQLSKRWSIKTYSPALLENATNVRKNLENFHVVKTEENHMNNVINIS